MKWRRLQGVGALGVLLTSLATAQPADDVAVRQAIDRGVAVLKPARAARFHAAGSASLVGLTLLECGVPADDPAVRQRADEVRQAALDLDYTYSLSLAILFLDRLGDAGDRSFVQSLGARLLAGQNPAGGWSYHCPPPPAEEVRRLRSLLGQRGESLQVQKQTRPDPPPPLPAEIQEWLRKIRPAENHPFGVGDNSNTQFAILGLWAARRHGLPIDQAIQRVGERFRRSQGGDGGWGYLPIRGTTSSGAMTCAGLLGLAMSIGHANEAILLANPPAVDRLRRDPAQDASVRAGLLALGASMAALPNAAALRKGHSYYYLWSVERVGVAYDLKAIANQDWYAWGRAVLLDSQRGDGSWQGEHGAEIDTCFALLFLRRANVTPDLTVFLKGRVADPAQATLKAGGVAGAAPPLADAAQLKQQLLNAGPEQQARLIERLRDQKGREHTLALAAAIAELTDPARGQARDALAQRLTRMTAATLRDQLSEEQAEIRRAAALACAMKEDQVHTADLIGLLDDAEVMVVRAALVGLQHLHGVNLGSHAQPADRAQTVAAWKDWWRKR